MLVVAAFACLRAVRGAGMTDEPIAGSGPTVYLDGDDWLITSVPLPPAPPPPTPKCAERCCFEPGMDWRPLKGNLSGRIDASAHTQTECCEACATAPDCFVAVLSDVHEGIPAKCWLKTVEGAAGGSYYRGGGRTSCMPGAKRPPAPPPPPSPPQRILGSVPGDLLTDLQNADAIPDPLFEDNFLANASVWTDSIWTYSKVFTVPSGRSWLVFDGIKMGAAIHIDGRFIGNATNQFRRLHFDVAPGHHTLEVVFDPRIEVDGRFMACTGGWDWAPYTNTYQHGGGGKSERFTSQAATFTFGITRSVYVINVAPPQLEKTPEPPSQAPVAVTYFVPTIFYAGDYPVSPLEDGRHAGFTVQAKLFLSTVSPVPAIDGVPMAVNVVVTGDWGAKNRTTATLKPSGESVVELTLHATAEQIKLWWPNGVGPQPLYNVTADVAGTVTTSRTIGFRHFALVTGNDTDPKYIVDSKALQGNTLDFGMLFRVNGAAVLSKGANGIAYPDVYLAE
jgi:hypothetical protein